MVINSQKNFNDLLEDIKTSGGMNLCVGAGVTYPLTPLWDDLINSLISFIIKSKVKDKDFRKNFVKAFKKKDLYEKALFIKNSLSDLEYKLLIKSELYKNYADYQSKITDTLIPSIKDICGTNLIKSIISINYDNYLFRYLKENKIPINDFLGKDKSTIKSNPSKNTIPIFYIHGNITPDQTNTQLKDSEITLSPDDYFFLFNNPMHWQNYFPLSYMTLSPTIFIGTSLRDINLYRLINASSHVYIKANSYMLKSFKNETEKEEIEVEITILEMKGVHVIDCGEYKNTAEHHKVIEQAIKSLVYQLNSLK